MRFPDFLIIGAMKAGTTTLFFDLLQNSGVCMPEDKEPYTLVRDDVLTETGRAKYAAMFARARQDQVCGEASTGYTKIPQYPGVPERAHSVCGQGLRLIYILRDPIDRIVSHYYHEFTYRAAGRSIDEEVRSNPCYIAFSKYAMQTLAWLDVFDRENLMLVRFDKYMLHRQEEATAVASFLGVGDRQGEVEADKVYNKGDRRPVHRGVLSTMYHSPAYRRAVRPLVPRSVRQWAFQTFFPRGPARPAPPSDDTVRWIVDQLAPDLEDLARIDTDARIAWTPEELLERHLARRRTGCKHDAGVTA